MRSGFLDIGGVSQITVFLYVRRFMSKTKWHASYEASIANRYLQQPRKLQAGGRFRLLGAGERFVVEDGRR
jgi:hypothetical protein